jgi:hypothetical protein
MRCAACPWYQVHDITPRQSGNPVDSLPFVSADSSLWNSERYLTSSLLSRKPFMDTSRSTLISLSSYRTPSKLGAVSTCLLQRVLPPKPTSKPTLSGYTIPSPTMSLL